MPALPLNTPLPDEPRLRKLCRALLAAPALEIDVDAMADKAGMSRRHFTRLFRRQTGMSFAAWRQQACLLAALTRLGGGEPVTHVAVELGHASTCAFSAALRRILGAPPSRHLARQRQAGWPQRHVIPLSQTIGTVALSCMKCMNREGLPCQYGWRADCALWICHDEFTRPSQVPNHSHGCGGCQ